MARRVLKERIFAPAGKVLGTFFAKDLETFDIEYEESDEVEETPEEPQGKSKKPSSVPNPKDDNPLKPEQEEDNNNNNSNSGSGGNSDSNEDDNSDEPFTGELDPYGEDLDDIEKNMSDDTQTGGGGSSEPGDEDLGDSGDSDGGDGSGEDGDGVGDSSGEGESGDSEDGESGNGEGEPGDGSEDGESGNGEKSGDSDGGSGSKGNGENQSGNGEPTDDENGEDVGTDGGSPSNDIDYNEDDWDPGLEEDNGWGNSDLQKAIDELEDGETDIDKEVRKENEAEEEKKENNNGAMLPEDKASKDEVRAAKDVLGKAVKDAEKSKKENESERDRNSNSQLEDELLGAVGAGGLTTLFNRKTATDWKANLERVLDQALGFDIVTNPNLFNKKIEDAPPGREDEIPEISNILVMLDCSGSMGYNKFIQVIDHLDTMMRVRNMGNTTFHIIDWGDSNIRSVAKTYVKVKGKRFKNEIRTHSDHGWGTQLIPGLMVASQKVHKPEAIIILTDAEIWDGGYLGSSKEGQIAQEYLKKHRKKIIWALTQDANLSVVDQFDPTARKMKRAIKFRK